MNPTLPVGGTARGATTRRVDRVNKKIVSMLQVDGRKSFVELARETGISEAAARARVHRLRLDRVIQIVAVTDPLQLGFKHEAMVAVQLNTDAEAVADRLADIHEIDFIVLVTASSISSSTSLPPVRTSS